MGFAHSLDEILFIWGYVYISALLEATPIKKQMEFLGKWVTEECTAEKRLVG